MIDLTKYDSDFYNSMIEIKDKATNATSAREIVPYILELFPNTKTVIDVGGAIGIWATVFMENGVQAKVMDGPWVKKEQLLIPQSSFVQFDIQSCCKYEVKEKFDLAMCLEVGEHIDQTKADYLVELLVSLSDVIVFGAAIPHQGGVNHVNEQFPSYWKKKFESYGYVTIDPIRGEFCENNKVLSEYTQNTLVYVKSIDEHEKLIKYKDVKFVCDFVSKDLHRNYLEQPTWKDIFRLQWLVIIELLHKLFDFQNL